MDTWRDVVKAYLDAWNRHDAQGVAAVFADGGTYEDSSTGGHTLTGEAITAMCERLFAAFPDLRFESIYEAATVDGTRDDIRGGAVDDTRDGTAVAQWVMRGTNTGSLNGLPPSGREVALPGIDVITIHDRHISSLRGYFDRQDFAQQLGLDVIVQPKALGPFSFGISSHLSMADSRDPDALSLTWIDLRPEDDVREFTTYGRDVMADMVGMQGHQGTWVTLAGKRSITVSAWSSVEDVDQINRSKAHQKAVRALFDRFGSAVGTSVWVKQSLHSNLVRCDQCGKMNVHDRVGGQCGCGATLPDVEGYL